MASYVEEKEFTLRLSVRYAFPDDYEGDEDGYQWTEQFAALTREVVQAAAKTIAAAGTWRVRPGNRGRPVEDEITLVVEREAEATPAL